MENQTMPIENTPIPPKKSGIGAIIATIIVIILIIIGGLYFWGKRIETQQANQAAMQQANTPETATAAEATATENVSPDDSLNTLNAELQATQTSNLTQ